MSNSLLPHGLQHAGLPCPSPTLGAYSNSSPSKHVFLCHPLLLPPSVFPSIRVFSKESVLRIRWPKYWSFRFSSSPSNKYLGLISFRIDWFDLLAVQGTLKSLLQHYNSKASILQHSAFFTSAAYLWLLTFLPTILILASASSSLAGLMHCRRILYQVSHKGSPRKLSFEDLILLNCDIGKDS